ncbi:uncharacterized protein LOC130906860 [Corythoichthys intestinalis]|uniref:uncharacterized protein LOC130906860 n=1 Tax=Corythoichthys intestinalis TaxID=161448 RepID=UPI0025A51090|nr:uncharacterized protein LOC130906860 [Corythoichthys intestinalis]
MERMEVDQCAGSSAGPLRRSISAPMITSVSERSSECSPVYPLRQRRVSVNCNRQPQDDDMEASPAGSGAHRLRWAPPSSAPFLDVPAFARPLRSGDLASGRWQRRPFQRSGSRESGITPNSSPGLTRRFRAADVGWPASTPLKRKGGAETDGPPKKLFVTGVSDPAGQSSYALSASAADSARGGIAVHPSSPFAGLTPPPLGPPQ